MVDIDKVKKGNFLFSPLEHKGILIQVEKVLGDEVRFYVMNGHWHGFIRKSSLCLVVEATGASWDFVPDEWELANPRSWSEEEKRQWYFIL